MQMVTQQFCLQGSPGALCNTDSSPGYPVIQKGEKDLLDLPLPFHIYLPIFFSPTSSSHVPWGVFGRKYGYVDKEGSRHAPTGPSHLRSRWSELQGALEQQHASQRIRCHQLYLVLLLVFVRFLQLFSLLFMAEWEYTTLPVCVHKLRLIIFNLEL